MTSWRTRLSSPRRVILGVTGALLILVGAVATVGVVNQAPASANAAPVANGAPADGSSASVLAELGLALDGTKLAGEMQTLCSTFESSMVSQLGVSADKLDAAMLAAAKATVDKAAADGVITTDRATQLKTMLDGIQGPICQAIPNLPQGLGAGGSGRMGMLDSGALLDAAAKALGETSAALTDEIKALKSGEDLKTIAAKHNVPYDTLTKAIHDAAKTQLDEAVTAKRIDQAQADKTLAALDAALQNGRFIWFGRLMGPGNSDAWPGAPMGPGMGRGFWGGHMGGNRNGGPNPSPNPSPSPGVAN